MPRTAGRGTGEPGIPHVSMVPRIAVVSANLALTAADLDLAAVDLDLASADLDLADVDLDLPAMDWDLANADFLAAGDLELADVDSLADSGFLAAETGRRPGSWFARGRFSADHDYGPRVRSRSGSGCWCGRCLFEREVPLSLTSPVLLWGAWHGFASRRLDPASRLTCLVPTESVILLLDKDCRLFHTSWCTRVR